MTQDGKLYIDGKDAFAQYGVFVERYGYGQVIGMPPFKTVESTEWDEYDGEEYDLSAPVFDTRTFPVNLGITDIALAGELFAALSDKSYHVFDFRELDRKYKLRLVSNGSLSSNIRLGKLALSFADDFAPVTKAYAEELENDGVELDGYNTILDQAPLDEAPAGFRQRGYELDGTDLSRFGVYVVKGSDDNIQKAPKVRDNLTVDAKTRPGVEYDGENVSYKAKDVQLSLFIHAADITDFWTRWNALLTALAQPGERILYTDKSMEEHPCFYRKCSVSRFDILRNGRVWCEFTVTVTFTEPRPAGSASLLASEDGELVATEEHGFFISMT